jgi:hypothetical protein
MNNPVKSSRRLNHSLTKRVIELHGKGYDHDFLMSANQRLLCLQNNANFKVAEVNINLVD